MEQKLLLRKCLIVFCLCLCVYGDENAINLTPPSENALNLNENAPSENTTHTNSTQNATNLSQNTQNTSVATSQNTEKIKNENNKNNENSSQNAQTTNNESQRNANQNTEKIDDESQSNASQNAQNLQSAENATSDDSDFGGFDDFEAEFDTLKVNDPLSGYNKMMTSFNVALYTYVLRPVAKGYEFVMPEFARVGIKNFFSYISMPIRFAGNVLQFKFKEAGTELKRFGINTIFGFFGLIDAASKGGIPIHHADFGLVLAHWGVGGGFHLVLPVLGPSNLRDTLSIPVNWYASPITYVATYDTSAWINWLSVGITSFGIMNSVSLEMQTLDTIYNNTPNLYPFLRDAYEKRRTEMAK